MPQDSISGHGHFMVSSLPPGYRVVIWIRPFGALAPDCTLALPYVVIWNLVNIRSSGPCGTPIRSHIVLPSSHYPYYMHLKPPEWTSDVVKWHCSVNGAQQAGLG
jgi:hypothetical protein